MSEAEDQPRYSIEVVGVERCEEPSQEREKKPNDILVAELMKAIERGEQEESKEVGAFWKRLLTTIKYSNGSSIGAIIAAGMLSAAFAVSLRTHFIVEAIVVLVLFISNLIVSERDSRMRSTVILRRARAQVSSFIQSSGHDKVSLRGVPGEIAVKRDGFWTFVLPNMLVPGDQILIPRGTPIPAGSTPSMPQTAPSTTATTPTNTTEWLTQYVVNRAPGCKQLEEAFEFPKHRPHSKLENYVELVRRLYALISWITFFIALIVGIIRYFVESHDIAYTVLAQPAYVLVAQIIVALPNSITAIIESFANARILSVFHVLQNKHEAKEKEQQQQQPDEPQLLLGKRVNVPLNVLWNHFSSLLFGLAPAVMRSSKLFHMLGSVTTCVFLDKDVTLIESTPLPERVYLPAITDSNQNQNIPSTSTTPNTNKTSPTTTTQTGTMLNLSSQINPGGSVSISFDDSKWAQLLPILKPIGLAALLHRPLCRIENEFVSSPHICNKVKMPPDPAAAVAAAVAADAAAAIAGPQTEAGFAAIEVGNRWKRAFIALTRNYARPFSQCMCLLSSQIGFTEKALDNFVRLKEIHTYASTPNSSSLRLSREPPYMTSLVVKDVRSGTLQLLSKGSTPVLLSHCSTYWDGKEVREMTQQVREMIAEEYKHLTDAYTVIGFSYKPIFKKHGWLFQRAGVDVRLTSVGIPQEIVAHASVLDKHHLRDVMLSGATPNLSPAAATTTTKHEHEHEETSHPHHHHHQRLISELQQSNVTIPSISDASKIIEQQQEQQQQRHPSSLSRHHSSTHKKGSNNENNINRTHEARQRAFEEIQTDQIFIGMTALRNPPREGAESVIEILNKAGIRFMYFSSDDERRSTQFASKLGLETDWNAIISLRDPVQPQSPYMDGPARLPRGISNIRKHIKEVDPVPLSVPVFCDCTAESSAEMIEILQENGEIVLCVGNGIETRSTQAFARASISMSMQPATSHCLCPPPPPPLQIQTNENQQQQQQQQQLEQLSSKDYITNPSTGNLSTDLTSLPCSFVMHSKTPFTTIAELIREGRHVLNGVVSCLLCFLTLISAIHGVSFISTIAFIPPIFSGYQLLWLCCIIAPILTLPMLAGTLEGPVMTQICGKSFIEKTVIRHTAMLVASQAAPITISCIVIHLITLVGLWGAGWNAVVHPNQVGNLSSSSIFVGSEILDGVPSIPLLYAQNMAMLAFVIGAAFAALAIARPSNPFPQSLGLIRHSVTWFIAVLLCLGLQLSFFFISLKVADGFLLLQAIPWLSAVLLACSVILIIITGFISTFVHKRWWDSYQLELRLVFDTKLGMYSPVATRSTSAQSTQH